MLYFFEIIASGILHLCSFYFGSPCMVDVRFSLKYKLSTPQSIKTQLGVMLSRPQCDQKSDAIGNWQQSASLKVAGLLQGCYIVVILTI